MGGVKKLYEESELRKRLKEYLITISDEELRDFISNHEGSFYKGTEYWDALKDERYAEEISWLSKERHAFEDFLASINEIKSILPKNPSPILIKMNYSYVITLMESCLCDMLKSIVLYDDKYMINALTKIEDLTKQRVSLFQVHSDARIVQKMVLSILSDILYHNIPKVVSIYSMVLGEKQPENVRDKTGVICKTVDIRHDIVHRNGFNKDGVEHILNAEILTLAIDNIAEFIQYMHRYIESSKHKIEPF
ncbi:hypothetical protein ACIMOF_04140 [Escherichia coli]